MEVVAIQAEVDSDDAVFGLAQPSTPLLLDSGSLLPLLGVVDLIDEADRVRAHMLVDDEPLNSRSHAVLIPDQLAEELLEVTWSGSRFQGDRLDAFLVQGGELPSNVDAEMSTRVLAAEAIAEVIEEPDELRLQLTDLVDVQGLPTCVAIFFAPVSTPRS